VSILTHFLKIEINFMRKIYERVIGPALAKSHEFRYVDGFPVKKDKPIWLIYLKTDKIEMFVDEDEVPVFPRNPKNQTLFKKYKRAKKGLLKREIYLKSFTPVITNSIRKKGEFPRGFATYVLDSDKSIFEIHPDHAESANFYKTVLITWKISGMKEDVKKQNQKQLELADETLEGMRFLLNPLQFYDVVEETDYSIGIQEKLNRLKHY
tara:strand:- start:29 stop:655 length:627 start_codon:yes stop_codon:yes gene_type:complete